MRGIRSLKSGDSVSFLTEHISDSHLLVSYLAIITLAEIAGRTGEFGPNMRSF
jgi:hypothetical protein